MNLQRTLTTLEFMRLNYSIKYFTDCTSLPKSANEANLKIAFFPFKS